MFNNNRNVMNKLLASESITVFCKYGFKDLTPTDKTDDTEFNSNYAKKFLPTYFENVVLADTNIIKPENASLGSWTAVIDTTRKISKIYRIIEGVRYDLVYLPELEYNSKTYEEQLKKYFTFKKGIKFADRIIDNLEYELPDQLVLASRQNVFMQNDSREFEIDEIAVDRVTISITGDIQWVE